MEDFIEKLKAGGISAADTGELRRLIEESEKEKAKAVRKEYEKLLDDLRELRDWLGNLIPEVSGLVRRNLNLALAQFQKLVPGKSQHGGF